MFGRRRRRRDGQERVRAHFAARAERQRRLGERAAAWRAGGEVTPERVVAEYEARLAALDPDIAELARPVAAWVLREGEPGVHSSHMGGAPALDPDEPWPEPGYPMRFWAQLNLAELAPFADAFGIAMPRDGLLQLFAGEGGGELARHLPAGERLELRRDIPEATSLLIDLVPEALVGGDDMASVIYPDLHGPQRECTIGDDLSGYSFGWWPMSRPDEPVTFLAVCNSSPELGLRYSDEGFLWATVPTAGDIALLRCEGEST
jgi:hypothetical protein